MNMWMVRAGQGGAWADLLVEESCVGVDFWSESFQAPPTALTREELAVALQKAQPELSKAKLIVAAGQFYRFLHDLARSHARCAGSVARVDQPAISSSKATACSESHCD